MKNKITHNIGLKLISLVISILLWAVVTSISDPAVSQSFYNVPVELLNVDAITDSVRVYEILDESDVIAKVTIKAARSVIADIDADDIVATADVSDLSSLDTISIKLGTKVHQDQIISIQGSADTVKLKIENRKTKTLALTTEIIGEPADGYIAGNVTTAQNLVKITGAESVVDSIHKATAEVDVSGFRQNIDTAAEIKLYDNDGNAVDSSKLSMNMNVVGVTVDILETKTVPVTFNVMGEPASGYAATGVVESDKSTVNICGDAKVIGSVSSIIVPSEAIDISDQRGDYTVNINIEDYLPDGVYLVDDNNKFGVTVYISPETSKHITISTDDVEVINVPDDYSVTIALDDGTIVDVVGLADDLSGLNKDSINPVIDISSWASREGKIEEGFYSIDVSFTLPGTVRLVDPVKATVHIVRKE